MNKLIIICGLSFAGKSTLGKAIAERFEYEAVDVDSTKVSLYGIDVNDEELTREQWDKIYTVTDEQIVDYLHSGKNVVDASRNFTRAERNHIRTVVTNLGHAVTTVYVNTPESVARRRWQKNREEPSRRDVTDNDFEEIVRGMEPPAADEQPLEFHFDEKTQTWIAKHIDILT